LRGDPGLRLLDPEVRSRVRLSGDEEPDRVGAVLLEQGPRIDYVPLCAVHRATASVEAQSVDEDAVERLRPPHKVRLEHRVVEPRPDDFAALRPEREGEVRGEVVRVRAVAGEVEVRYARVHPGVEHTFLADELLGAALRA